MSAGKYNIEIEKKATYTRDFVLYSTYISAGNVGNVPIDLTGASVAAKIKRRAGDATALISFTAVVVDAENGVFRLSLTAAQTAALAFDVGVYDVLITFPSGNVEKFIEGNVVLGKTVT